MPFANTVQIKPYNVDTTASYTFGNVTTGNVTVTNGIFWANGASFYGNNQVAAYITYNTLHPFMLMGA
jgi:hypothetical protein